MILGELLPGFREAVVVVVVFVGVGRHCHTVKISQHVPAGNLIRINTLPRGCKSELLPQGSRSELYAYM